MSGSLREQERLWEHGQQEVSTAFMKSPKLLGYVFLRLDRNMENMCSISFWQFCEEKRKQIVYFEHQNVYFLCLHHQK